MLFRLEIENFYSVAERQAIDFSLRVPEDPRFALVYPNSKKRAPKLVAVFGPNASGKTVFLRAIAFLALFARDSFQFPPNQPLPTFSFKNEHWAKNPTRLAVEIGGRPLFPETEGATYPRECIGMSLKFKARKDRFLPRSQKNLFFINPARDGSPF
ncbi:AAA family ATPase [Methylacidiphilum kamchatkense]|uniref:AAA family ATPase n=1 Tax=Methylacidiphilum kamchatkense TaxID=431057 RepID=UPI00117FFBF4|nr:AAA family ATPase [Methylacidiphilum kamchatkense]